MGRLCLFGGFGCNGYSYGYFNDFWVYNRSSGNWAWSGVAKSFDVEPYYGNPDVYPAWGGVKSPGSRYRAISWDNGSGDPWMFGGARHTKDDYELTNDLWSEDRGWVWMGGSTLGNQPGVYGTMGLPDAGNWPGARMGGASASDQNGNLWMFGGNETSGVLNDLWNYKSSLNKWTWVKGTTATNDLGFYGNKGLSNPLNNPPARYDATAWADDNGAFWLFGGSRFLNDTVEHFNDLWKYDPATGNWTWMSGSDLPDQGGTYGTRGTGGAANGPGARRNCASWTDGAGNLWLFGGEGYADEQSGWLSDVWKYNIAEGQWIWITGPRVPDGISSYEIAGVPSAANTPAARSSAYCWRDAQGRVWLYGGSGVAGPDMHGVLSDLWMLQEVDPPTTVKNWGLY